MKYFFDCKNLEEAKLKYRKLAMELHPDKGGSNAQMSELTKQYDDFVAETDYVNPFEESLNQAFEEAKRKEQYYTGFAYRAKGGYQYRPAGDMNNTYFYPDELQKVRQELNEAEVDADRWQRRYNDSVITRSDLERQIAELKKNSAAIQEWYQRENWMLTQENLKLKKPNLWQSIKTAFAGLRGFNNG